MTPAIKPAKKKPLQPAPIPQGSTPAPFTSADVAAIQALRQGIANEGQQARALDWILNSACALNLWPYRDSQRETDIGLGRHFVGQQIVGLLRINLSNLKQHENEEKSHG